MTDDNAIVDQFVVELGHKHLLQPGADTDPRLPILLKTNSDFMSAVSDAVDALRLPQPTFTDRHRLLDSLPPIMQETPQFFRRAATHEELTDMLAAAVNNALQLQPDAKLINARLAPAHTMVVGG